MRVVMELAQCDLSAFIKDRVDKQLLFNENELLDLLHQLV
jgi:hypothetical protein